MNFRILSAAACLLLLAACSTTAEMSGSQPATAADGAAAPPATMTLADIMHDMVMPSAEVLWNATAVYVTEEGEDDRSPKNDAEWLQVDKSRVALEQAIQALLTPGLQVDEAGAEAEYPEEDLSPRQIQALIDSEPEVWVGMVQALDGTVQQAKQAIQDQDVEALTEIGGAIDDACEGCHLHFWYPEH